MAPRHSSSSTQPAQPGVHGREWAAELAGTACLLLAGLSAVCIDFAPGSPVKTLLPGVAPRLLLTGLLFAGAGSLVAVSPLGRLSGAHLNPAVTFAFWLRGSVHPHDLGGYIGAQLLGAGIGTALAALAWGRTLRSVGFGATLPQAGVGVPAAVAIEAAMTAVLVSAILLMVSSMRTARWTPVVAWLVAALLVWQGARFTGTGLNPARSLWPDVLADRFGVYWIYVVGPLVGAAGAVAISRGLMRRGPLTAKLFHDPDYPSVFKSMIPTAPPAP